MMTEPDDDLPQFPLAFRDGLKFIAGETISERLLKVRRFIEWQLRVRRCHLPPDQFAHALKAAFLARQRKPFADQVDLDAFAAGWLTWWNDVELPAVRQRNAKFLRKPVDPDNESRG